MTPMYHLPADDAHMREWLRPVSATLTTRRISYFSNYDTAGGSASGLGAMINRVNRKRRKRAAKIDMGEFWRLHAQGVGVAKMAAELGVSTRSVERALTMRRCDG